MNKRGCFNTKKILCVLSVTMILFSCAACGKVPVTPQPGDIIPTETTESVSSLRSYSIYVPNDNADGFDMEIVSTEEISAETVLTELKNRNVLPDAVSMNSFGMDNGLITMDLNQAFADIVCSMGTSGELMIVGSVVNTFLDAFQAEYVYFTVNGQMLESGHTVYDSPMSFFSTD